MYLASDGSEVAGKKAVMGALSLYLDFINLFLMLLRLFGSDRIKGIMSKLGMEEGEPIEHNIYRGQNRNIGTGRIFGGQVLAQSLVQAQPVASQEFALPRSGRHAEAGWGEGGGQSARRVFQNSGDSFTRKQDSKASAWVRASSSSCTEWSSAIRSAATRA